MEIDRKERKAPFVDFSFRMSLNLSWSLFHRSITPAQNEETIIFLILFKSTSPLKYLGQSLQSGEQVHVSGLLRRFSDQLFLLVLPSEPPSSGASMNFPSHHRHHDAKRLLFFQALVGKRKETCFFLYHGKIGVGATPLTQDSSQTNSSVIVSLKYHVVI